jgi:hypothetical protein
MEALLLVVLHFIPTIIAFFRYHKSKFGILAMNLLLGWTGIFWILALIWSLCNPSSNSVTVINNNNLNGG